MGFFTWNEGIELGYVIILVEWLIAPIIFAVIFFIFYKKIRLTYFLSIFLLIYIFIINTTFPSSSEGSPAQMIVNSIKVFISYDRLDYMKLFDNMGNNIYERMSAIHKFKDSLPQKVYNIEIYREDLSGTNLDDFKFTFILFLKNQNYFCSDSLMRINYINKDSIIFYRKVESTEIVFLGTTQGLDKYKETFDTYNNYSFDCLKKYSDNIYLSISEDKFNDKTIRSIYNHIFYFLICTFK
jgi:hypothetical protein